MTDRTPLTKWHLAEYEHLITSSTPVGAAVASPGMAASLLAEVRRLQAELATALRPNTPRLCACGHSNHTHTVPAPHACFAFGKTCPCEAFQQLPHDEAVAQLARNVEAAEQRRAAGEQPAAEGAQR
ncbi:hypothetical protein ACIBAC_11355 [Streptomyces sp. NPDC051362]|uniref:hypothetical protein n=1 Tax=Streptomyces sp. NPDC051362 TaxID=3365651 RepID=UPI0037B4374C